MFKSFAILVVFSYSVNGWILNDVMLSKLKEQLKMDVSDLANDIASDDIASQRFTLIYPGTKWCGAGNVADNYDDLGPEKEVDKCCRNHDFCADYIPAGETKYNITNDAFFTRLSCDCDVQFRQCLRATRKRTAHNIGSVYFNILGTQCFRNDYPVLECARKGGWLKKKCIEYKYNKSETKRYQWFDVIEY